MNITFITGNASKAQYVADYLELPVGHQALELPEVQSLDLEEVVCCKAQEAFHMIDRPVLVEDTSLVLHALNELPGPLVKWFEKSLGYAGICRLLDGYEDRSATATSCFCLYDGKDMHMFSGSMDGTIAAQPQGDDGFGWNSIFIHPGETRSRAGMTHEEKHRNSMRKIALDKLREHLLAVG